MGRVVPGILSPMCLDCMKGHPHGIDKHIPFNQEGGTVKYILRSDRPFRITNILTWGAGNCTIDDITIDNYSQVIGTVPGCAFTNQDRLIDHEDCIRITTDSHGPPKRPSTLGAPDTRITSELT